MEKHEFLSDAWVDAAHAIRAEFHGRVAPPAHEVRMNQVITDVPFGEGTINAHLDTGEGEATMDVGHVDEPDLTVTTDYETAKAIMIDNDPQAGMQAFMQGKVKVQGDMTKLMLLQQQPADAAAQEMAQRIKDMTA